jgi:hypothetical protein
MIPQAERALLEREEDNERARGRGEERTILDLERTVIVAAEAIIEALYRTRR